MAAPNEQSISLALEARGLAVERVGQLLQELRKLREEHRQLQQAGQSGIDVGRQLGENYLRQSQAVQELSRVKKTLQNDSSALNQAQQRLRDTMREAAQQIQSAAASTGGLAGGVANVASSISTFAASMSGATAAIAGTTAAIAGFVAVSLAASKAIGDFQERQDITAETLQITNREAGALALGASNIGRSFSQIEPSLFRFTTVLGEAREGSKQAVQAFERLGLDANQFSSTTDALKAVSAALEEIDGRSRNLAIRDLFGRGGSSVLPVLRQDLEALAVEAERTGNVLSESAQKTAREADVAWDQLGNSTRGLINLILVQLAPLGTTIARELGSFVRSMLGITQETNKAEAEFKKMFEQASRYHEEARRGALALDEEAKAQARLNEARARGLAPDRSSPVPGQAPPSREAPTALPGQTGLALPETARETRATGAGAVGLRIGDEVLRQTAAARREAAGLTEEQEKQLEATRETIALLQERHALGVSTAAKEAEVLVSLREQVRSRAELNEVEAAIQRQRQGFLREIRESGATLQENLSGFTNAIAATFIAQLKSIAEQAKNFTPPRTEPRANPSIGVGLPGGRGVTTQTDPFGTGGVFVSTAGTARGARNEDETAKRLQEQRLKEISAIGQTVASLSSFIAALGQGTRATIAAIGQFVAAATAAAVQLGASATLGPIGSIVGGVIGLGSLLFQEGGRRVAGPVSAAAIAYGSVSTPALALQSGARIVQSSPFIQRGSPLAPIMAQHGIVISGARGIDGQHAILGQGEMVTSHSETEFMIHAIREMRRDLNMLTAPQNAIGENVIVERVENHFHSQYSTFQDVRRNLDTVASETARAIRLGSYGRGG